MTPARPQGTASQGEATNSTGNAVRPVVLLTGASRGIGAATVELLVSAGADVALLARDADALADVARRADPSGKHSFCLPADVADLDAAPDMIDQVLQRFGRLDGLVNNAAVMNPLGMTGSVDVLAYERLLRVNVLAPLALFQAALPALRAASGRVVNVVSVAATMPVPGAGAYGVSKAALTQLTRVIATEEANVTAVALDPGPTDTDMMADVRSRPESMPPEWAARYRRMKDEGMLNAPDVPARAMAWLALNADRDLTGRVLTCQDREVAEPALASFGEAADYRPPPPPE